MKRFLIFGHTHYEPCGGWLDFVADFDTKDEAEAKAKAMVLTSGDEDSCEEAHVVDTDTGEIILDLPVKKKPFNKPIEPKWPNAKIATTVDAMVSLIEPEKDVVVLVKEGMKRFVGTGSLFRYHGQVNQEQWDCEIAALLPENKIGEIVE